MGTISNQLHRARAAVTGCVAVGVVEPSTGRLVAAWVGADGEGGRAERDLLAGWAGEQSLRSTGFREAVALRDAFVHVVLHCGGRGELAAVFVCRAGPAIDGLLLEARAALVDVERILPAAEAA